ncbi:hypothetical protein M2459_002383 [Parabacteroides sp. PF5-5]|uniref:hypothetical protein n=1 Tax=unclassified Parabacteroides TaxID=2649774 RepID=UPI002476DD5F|nr:MULTISPECIES: hypothetical protein [unclassified Parabacteroides]MDH6305283.1 hypothetical protein [Parabacteroides sp. PH5-39]MDH6316636.1 hypothetical protein [Parabacteroides sp. PF5-13]MDH6320184.1 hypothetical protein [Parabacteroides sp. PH5-13]MDH6323873.1 hypothetical protein [Parabacteroides sp. PH5-8]MDH6327861.1 hypothetical protein [Parabacteroides sp. PH5-41]
MSESKNKNRHSDKVIKMLISIIFIVVGLLLVALFADSTDKTWQPVVFNFGTALSIAGIVALFNESLFGKNESPKPEGLKIITKERQSFSGYYNWVTEKNVKTIKCSGHAVLKSMKDGLNKKYNLTDTFINKMKEGTNIYVLFFDPELKIIEKVTTDIAGENKEILYNRLDAALAITKELHDKINNELKNSADIKGTLNVKLIDAANNQYAYHYVEYQDKSEVFLGFYTAGILGNHSPVFGVEDKEILSYFDGNFNHLCHTSASLLRFESGILTLSPRFNMITDFVKGKLANAKIQTSNN